MSAPVSTRWRAVADQADDVWARHFKDRGLQLETRLGGRLPPNFPTVDRFADGVATSNKSLDTTVKTYQSSNALKSKVKGYVDSVAAFTAATHGGVPVRFQDIMDRQLVLAVPNGGVSDEQWNILQDVIGYGISKGVTVNIKRI